MKREERNPGFTIHKDSAGYRVYRDGSPCLNAFCKTKSAAIARMKEILKEERVCDGFLFGGKKKPLLGATRVKISGVEETSATD